MVRSGPRHLRLAAPRHSEVSRVFGLNSGGKQGFLVKFTRLTGVACCVVGLMGFVGWRQWRASEPSPAPAAVSVAVTYQTATVRQATVDATQHFYGEVRALAPQGRRIRISLPLSDVRGLSVGQAMRIPSLPPQRDARIARIFPPEENGHLAVVEVDLPGTTDGLRVGSTVAIDAIRDSAPGLNIPERALLQTHEGWFAFLVSGERVRIVPVRLLSRAVDFCVVEGELAVGDQVVVGPDSVLRSLTDGASIRLAPMTAASR
jgi:hypothetical protein